MTKEQAYERLELPVGSDLQVVRQKFAQLHNDFQMRIDNAPTPKLKQTFERGLEELKEAYAILNESEGMDDLGSLPRTEKTFDSTSTEPQSSSSEPSAGKITLEQALVLFDVHKQDTKEVVTTQVKKHIKGLQEQYDAVQIATIKEAYRQEIANAENAKKVVEEWIAERKQQVEQERSKQAQATIPPLAEQTAKPTLPAKKTNVLIYFIPILLIVGAGVIYFMMRKSGEVKPKPKGIFTQVATDSLTAIQNVATTTATKTPPQQAEDNKTTPRIAAEQPKHIKEENKAENGATNAKIKKWEEKSQWSAIVFNEGLARVDADGKYGYINRQGDVAIPLKYDDALDFSEGMAAVQIQGKWGYINKEGKVVIAAGYDYANDFRENIAYVRLNGKSGYIDKKGKIIIPLKYTTLDIFSEGLSRANLDDQWGFVDRSGNEVIPLKYRAARDFKDGVAAVYDGERWFYINQQGECVADCPD